MKPNLHHIKVNPSSTRELPEIVTYIRQHREVRDVPARIVGFYTEYSVARTSQLRSQSSTDHPSERQH